MHSSFTLRRHIENFIRSNPKGSRFPRDAELSERFGLARITVRRVLSALAHEGLLIRIQGKGTYIAGESDTEAAEIPARTDSVQTIVSQITASICRGELKRGDALPLYKQLCATLQVSPATVRRAYATLERNKIVTRAGRYYRVGRFLDMVRVHAPRDIVFFTSDGIDVSDFFTTHELAMSFKKMESELLVHGFKFSFATYSSLLRMVDDWITGRHFPYGLFLTGTMFGAVDENVFRGIRADIERLLNCGATLRPRILALATYFHIPDKRINSFSISHAITIMWRTLSTFLFEKGFRRAIIFFDDTTAGINHLQDAARMMPEIDVIDPSFDLQYAIRSPQASSLPDWLESNLYARASREHIGLRLSKYRPLTARDLETRMSLVGSIEEVVLRACKPLAVIVFNDEEAVRLIGACGRFGMRIPDDVSIVSFENNSRFYQYGITACVRDWETIGYVMAHAFIGDFPLQKSKRGFIDVPALILKRATTPAFN